MRMPMNQVEWRNEAGNICWFSEGFDPNLNSAAIKWFRMTSRKEKRMTRNEVVLKCCQVVRICSLEDAKQIVDLFESLGLIKFNEEEIKRWYQSENTSKWGVVKILEHDGKLHFWVGGQKRFEFGQ